MIFIERKDFMNQEKIGKFIAECRKKQNYTQEELAEKLGVTNKAISKWENGRSLPDVSLFTPVCGLLKISLNELFAGEYIPKESLTEKSDENLLYILENEKKQLYQKIISYLLCGIGLGLFVAAITITNEITRSIFLAVAVIFIMIGFYNRGKHKKL